MAGSLDPEQPFRELKVTPVPARRRRKEWRPIPLALIENKLESKELKTLNEHRSEYVSNTYRRESTQYVKLCLGTRKTKARKKGRNNDSNCQLFSPGKQILERFRT